MKNRQKVIFAIHPLTWVLAGISFMTGQFTSFFLLMSIIMIHEGGHILAALWFKWDIQKVTLLPFGGKLEIKGVLDRPFSQEAIVVLSGPFQHVVLGGLAFLYLRDWTYYSLFMQLNLQLLCFNLLPLWPLDGGRLMFLFLAKISPFAQAVKQSLVLSTVGLILTIGLSLWFFSFNLQLILLLVYVSIACYSQWRHRRILQRQFWLERWQNNVPQMSPRVSVVQKNETIDMILKRLKKGQPDMILIKENVRTIAILPAGSSL